MSEIERAVGQKSQVYDGFLYDPPSIRASFRAAFEPWGEKAHGLPVLHWTRFRVGEFEILERLGIPLKRVLHGEQEYETLENSESLPPKVTYVTSVEKVIEKSGGTGKLTFITFVTEFFGQTKLLARARSTMVVRG